MPAIAAVQCMPGRDHEIHALDFRFLTQDEARDVEALAARSCLAMTTRRARGGGTPLHRPLTSHLGRPRSPTPFRVGPARFPGRIRHRAPQPHVRCGRLPDPGAYLTQVDGTEFFRTIRFLTLLDVALPSYGGNRDGIG